MRPKGRQKGIIRKKDKIMLEKQRKGISRRRSQKTLMQCKNRK